MERPISWTENNWNNHKSEIIQFVKNPTRAQNARRSARNVKLRELLDCIGHTINPPLDNSLVLSEAPMAELMAKRLPLPTYGDVLEWPIVKSLVKKDAPISEMVCEFEIQKREITRLIIEWGERVKRELANMLREGREKEGLVADPP
ncbi:hypothetical protein FRC12_023331 [Ceratobasidium sp. 428]|nr:hypothetical protein FRC12_023331 [Ceratobasidium sp. 428]